MKILVVEDDADLREIIVRSLEQERYVVSQASTYRFALQKIEDYDYDCILLDIMLPDGNGLDLLDELQSLGKRVSVIILSAKDSIEDKVKGLDLGADDYLPKPFHLAELHARIKSLFRRNLRDGEKKLQVGNIELFPDSFPLGIHIFEIIFCVGIVGYLVESLHRRVCQRSIVDGVRRRIRLLDFSEITQKFSIGTRKNYRI